MNIIKSLVMNLLPFLVVYVMLFGLGIVGEVHASRFDILIWSCEFSDKRGTYRLQVHSMLEAVFLDFVSSGFKVMDCRVSFWCLDRFECLFALPSLLLKEKLSEEDFLFSPITSQRIMIWIINDNSSNVQNMNNKMNKIETLYQYLPYTRIACCWLLSLFSVLPPLWTLFLGFEELNKMFLIPFVLIWPIKIQWTKNQGMKTLGKKDIKTITTKVTS